MARLLRAYSWDSRDFVMDSRYANQGGVRRTVRARERAQLQRELACEVELTCVEPRCHPRFHDRTWSMNDEYQAPSDAVWRALCENDEGLRFVDFDGAYTVG